MACENYNRKCRLCLSSVIQEKCIFTTEDINKVSLASKIMVCTSLMVTLNDDKPQHLCSICEDMLESFFEFRNKCLHNHIQLCFNKTFDIGENVSCKDIKEDLSINPLNVEVKEEVEDVVEDQIEDYHEKIQDDTIQTNECTDNVVFNNQKMECANCLSEFFSLDDLDNHWNFCGVHKVENEEWHKELTTKCNVQNKTLDPSNNSAVQPQAAKSSRIKCNKCAQVFSDHKSLAEHLSTHIRYNCYVCSKSFIDKYELKYHMRTHSEEERFKCKECGKRFPRPSSLRRHYLIHTGEKPYKCSYCNKAFAHLYHAANHERVHKGEMPFKCRFCSKSFYGWSAKLKHERNHVKSNKMFQCDVCNRMFATHNEMDEHFNSHDSQMIWKCKTCKQEFKKPSALKTHAFTSHDDNIPFECEICSDSFPTHVDLKIHINIHTNDIL